MGVWYFKQPNGLYGRFSTVVDTVTDYNMDRDELYQNMVAHFGEYDPDVVNFDEFLATENENIGFFGKYHIHPFSDVIHDMTYRNETTESAQELLIVMGMPEDEARMYYFMDYPEDAEPDDPVWKTYDCALVKKEG